VGEGNGNPLQCSCLENPRDRGTWWAAVHGVAQSQTRLKQLSSSSSSIVLSVSHAVVFNSSPPMDCSSPGSSVHGILQARILEWVVIPFSRGSSQPRDQDQVSCTAGRFLPPEPPEKSNVVVCVCQSQPPNLSLPPLSPLETLNLFSTSVTLFLFCK